MDSNGDAVGEGVKGLLLYNNGTVCDDDFDDKSAAAICRLLGFNDASIWTSGLDWSVQESYNITMDDVRCSSELWPSCTFKESHDCGHTKDVFLTCNRGELLIRSDSLKGSSCSRYQAASHSMID